MIHITLILKIIHSNLLLILFFQALLLLNKLEFHFHVETYNFLSAFCRIESLIILESTDIFLIFMIFYALTLNLPFEGKSISYF